MTIKELKEIIKDVPDDAEVYISDEDRGDDVRVFDVYFALKNTDFRYRQSITDYDEIKAVEITGLF